MSPAQIVDDAKPRGGGFTKNRVFAETACAGWPADALDVRLLLQEAGADPVPKRSSQSAGLRVHQTHGHGGVLDHPDHCN